MSVFIGRERELREVGACLESARLVTLTGTGGIGKTRLAIRVARDHAWEYADGAWFVDLGALADASLVPQDVARALRVAEAPGTPLTETLQQALGTRQLLMVLDNCEHLLDACARLTDALVSRCPHLRILATSRQPLGLTGETVWPVPPLSLPTPKRWSMVNGQWLMADGRSRPPSTINHQPSTMMHSEAVHLFVERAQAAVPDFALTEQNAPAILQLCRRLDGIPLAIELAAARLKVLSIEQVAARLDDRFRLLTGGSRAALARQQTLRATLDWSYDLLAEPERILLRRLSVFAGGFTLEAAEAVCCDDQRPTTKDQQPVVGGLLDVGRSSFVVGRDEVLDLLTQLVDRSLVVVERREGVARYALLETTREYALEKLREAGEDGERRACHARFYLALAERAEPELRGAAQAEWLRRLEEEHDNCRAALDDFLSREAVAAGLRLGGVLGWFWWTRGYFSEGRERLQALLALSGCTIGSSEPGGEVRATSGGEGAGAWGLGRQDAADGSDPNAQRPTPPLEERRLRLAQAKALNAAGMLADDQGDSAAARALFRESLTLSRELGDEPGAAMALNNLGGLALQSRDFPAARALYEESLAIWRGIGDLGWAAAALTNLGRVAVRAGEYATARTLVASGLEIQRQLDDRRAIARSLNVLGNIAARLNDYAAAQALNEESLSISRGLGAKGVIEETLSVLGNIANTRGDHDAVLAFHGERLTIAREVGSASGIAESLYYLGLVARDCGDGNRARTLWSESLAISQRLGDERRIAECLEGFASLTAPPRRAGRGQGSRESRVPAETDEEPNRAQRAVRLFGAAAALRERVGAPVAPRHRAEYERQVAAVRAMLDAAAFAAAWEEGRTMPLKQAIALALSDS